MIWSLLSIVVGIGVGVLIVVIVRTIFNNQRRLAIQRMRNTFVQQKLVALEAEIMYHVEVEGCACCRTRDYANKLKELTK